MSLYGEYLKEKTKDMILEDEYGFATYEIIGTDVYIKDIYVRRDFRSKNIASSYADKICDIARKAACKRLIGSVVPSTFGSTTSLRVLLSYGMKLESSTNNFILFSKEL